MDSYTEIDLCAMFTQSSLECPEGNWSELSQGFEIIQMYLESGETPTLFFIDETNKRYKRYLASLELECSLSTALEQFLKEPNLYVAYFIDSTIINQLK